MSNVTSRIVVVNVLAGSLMTAGLALLPSCSEGESGAASSGAVTLQVSPPIDPLQALPRDASTDPASDALDEDALAVASEDHGHAHDALATAAQSGKYLFIFFSKSDDAHTAGMRQVFDAALGKARDRADAIAVDANDPMERDVITRFGVATAPMPLVLAVAPNGAVTAGFPGKCDEQGLLNAFVSPGMEKCLKALQERKLVLLCAQNGATAANAAATQGVEAFKAEARYAAVTEIVRIDPADGAESKLTAQLTIDPRTTQAVTALLAPPGTLVGTFQGAVTKDALVAALNAAASGTCDPSSCAPGACK